jgi:hypothetical protein
MDVVFTSVIPFGGERAPSSEMFNERVRKA